MGGRFEAHLSCPCAGCPGEVVAVAEPLPEGRYGVRFDDPLGLLATCSEGHRLTGAGLGRLLEKVFDLLPHEGEGEEG